MEKEYLIVTEAAKILGISRVAVFKKIKSGVIKAERIGNFFVIRRGDITPAISPEFSEADKAQINVAVRKAIRDYGESLKMLGRE